METLNQALLFGNNTDISVDERARVLMELEKIGSLTFKIQKGEDGWIAECKEIEGLIAGNTNPNPSSVEIESEIREAVFAVFNVKRERVPTVSPLQFSYTFA